MKRLQPEGPSAPTRRSSIVLSVLFVWLLVAGLASAPLHGSIPRDRPHDVASLALIEERLAAEPLASAFPPARLELGISEGDAAILRRVLVRQNPWSAFDPEGLYSWGEFKEDADTFRQGLTLDAVGEGLKIGVTNVVTAPYRFGNHIAEQGIGAYDLAKETGSSNAEALTLAVGTGVTRGTGALDVIESIKGQEIVGDSSSGISTQDFGSTTERVFHGAKGALQLATTAVVATKALGVGGNSAQVTRYMTEGEVAEAESTGNIPNYGKKREFRPTHVTTEKPLDSSSAAAKRYEIDPAPTHRATFPASRIKKLEMAPDGKPRTSGGGSQNATSEPIPIKPKEIKKLKP